MDHKEIKFFNRKQYGRVDAYTTDFEIARLLATMKGEVIKADPDGEYSISWNQMEALKQMGYTFNNILDPKRKK